jgi:hypothetical protein
MRPAAARALAVLHLAAVLAAAACSAAPSGPEGDTEPGADAGGLQDSAPDAPDATPVRDGGGSPPQDGALLPDGEADGGCFVSTVGVYGECVSTSTCAALGDRVSTPGYCPGAADIECCTDAPDVADNPPVPAGWQLMAQSDVTPDMTNWAVSILNDPVTYPMFSTTLRTFGSLTVMARVEWHPPDFQNGVVHRGVTLYEPTD